MSVSIAHIERWMNGRGWKPFAFQRQCWRAIRDGRHGVLNAPTGSGKTMAVFLGALLRERSSSPSPHVVWITPLRALAKDIAQAMQTACDELNTGLKVGVRTGDTSQTEKKRQRSSPPDILVITPESVHVLMSYRDGQALFAGTSVVVIDEWHELVGSKRGVQTELALARIRVLSPDAVVWGISATIGNLDEAMAVLLGSDMEKAEIVAATSTKKLKMTTLMPKNIDRYPWTGHLGLRMLEEAEKVIRSNNSTLVFTNTRGQAEIWFQRFLDVFPDYAGVMALHHGSLDGDVRSWVEQALKDGRLKVVFCTSSLDLGVDFAPVDAVIQVGSPKGIARFLQRAGRSGHQPGSTSKIWFLPTHALEIVEGGAMRVGIDEGLMEDRQPFDKPIDVLSQWLVTLACGDGFAPDALHREVRSTHAYADLTEEEWQWTLNFVKHGGSSLTAYPEFTKVIDVDGTCIVADRRTALRHRMSIGTIESESAMHVQFINGKRLGTIEESFISRLEPGDHFWFAGRSLEFIKIHEMTALVQKGDARKAAIPRWTGGRMPLSSQMSAMLRSVLHAYAEAGTSNTDRAKTNAERVTTNAERVTTNADHATTYTGSVARNADSVVTNNRRVTSTIELQRIKPLLDLQSDWSIVPRQHQFLIERFTSREGHHLFFYPFEGRLAHEGLAALFALRLSRLKPLTFSMAMNDYGFELLCDQPIPLDDALSYQRFPIDQALPNQRHPVDQAPSGRGLFTMEDLAADIMASANVSQMARRRFRQISRVAGLVFQGYPSKMKRAKHLQASSELFFDVFTNYDPSNLLLRQAVEETLALQLDEQRMREALHRIAGQDIIVRDIERPTPFAAPILVDRLREKMGSEKTEERIRKLIGVLQQERAEER
jgi:ATP-dependent helicase Lhr and Lhr-like helicase